MALDKETLQEIKAYMDERSEAWKVQAGDAARDVARDEVLAADGRIAKRNTFFGVGVGVVLLSVVGFSYQAITSGVEASTKQIATEVANDVAKEQLADGARLLELQQKLIDEIILGRGQVVAAMEKAKDASGLADGISKKVAALKDDLEASAQRARSTLGEANNRSVALSEQLRETEALQLNVEQALNEAKTAKDALEREAASFTQARAQLETAQKLLTDLSSGDTPVAETAREIVGFALEDDAVRALVIEAAAFPSGAVVPFARKELQPVCPEGWRYFAEAQDRFLIGASEAMSPGQTGGEAMVTLTVEQMPRHRHEVTWQDQHTISLNNTRGNVTGDNQYRLEWRGGAGWAGDNMSATWAGGSQPHNNIPPYLAIHFCKKD